MRSAGGKLGAKTLRLGAVALVTALLLPALGSPAVASPIARPPAAITAQDHVSELAEGPVTDDDESSPTTVLVAEPGVANAGAAVVEAVREVAESAGGDVRVEDPASGIVSLEVPVEAAESVERTLAAIPEVQDVATPALFEPMRRPSDRQLARQMEYLTTIRVPAAWNRTRGSAGVTVAVVDTGVAVGHPDLRSQVSGRYNAAYGGRAVQDALGHGTAVASIVAAGTNNARGIAGIGWRTRLLAVKVADRQGQIWGDALADGIRWAARNGADVINLSLGSRTDDPWVRRAVQYALDRDVLVVGAVSNSGSDEPVYPAAYAGVLGVGASDGDGLADFSDYGTHVDVSAPGTGLRAAVPGGYRSVTGTSFAAGVVSGQAALIMAEKPRMKAPRVARIIERTTRRIDARGTGIRRVNVFASVVRAEGVPTRPRDVGLTPRRLAAVVDWQPPREAGRSPIRRYLVQVKPVGGTWRVSTTVRAPTTSATVRGLRPDTSYKVRVVPVNAQGRGPVSQPKRMTTSR